jgi:hypothetical protein
MPPSDLTSQLNALTSLREVAQLAELERVFKAVAATGATQEECEGLLRLFERFPEDDGFGLFSSIITVVERCPSYEPLLLESINRVPTEFNLRMVSRLINAGIRHIGEVDLPSLLDRIAESPRALQSARRWARIFIGQAVNRETDA